VKKQIITLIAVATLTLSGAALAGQMEGHEDHQHGAAAEATHADVKKIQACAQCGMDPEKFSHSRMLLTYADGTAVGVCSISCTATELKASKGKALKSVEVGDYTTKKLIDAEKATWVIGGSKKGVMTRTAKWAFAGKDDAEAFIKKNGGKLGTYKEALALAEKE
jgi:nitrous oxide reductase accessory protein NosL